MNSKNYLFLLMLLSITFFTACEKDSFQSEIQEQTVSTNVINTDTGDDLEGNIKRKCPRQDLDMDGLPDIHKLADELTFVSNCGRNFRAPDCGDDLYEDESTVLVEQWCSPFGTCGCNYFPDVFTIMDQDDLIDEAKAKLLLQLTTCGIDEASFSFYATIDWASSGCDDIVLKLYASGSALCCANDE